MLLYTQENCQQQSQNQPFIAGNLLKPDSIHQSKRKWRLHKLSCQRVGALLEGLAIAARLDWLFKQSCTAVNSVDLLTLPISM